jgi:uncharacterized protein (DUF58 family)
MKNSKHKNGIWLGKMELPELALLANKKVISATPQNASTLGGPYLTKLKGRGMEFAEARPYQPGDDVRHIDWRVTARTGLTHTKLFREERERPVMLVLDHARPMFFGSRQRLKSVQAARMAALIGWRALLRGDRVGGVLFSEEIHREFRPRGDRRHYLRFLSSIMVEHNRVVDKMNESEWSFGSKFLFSEALRRLRHLVQPGSLVYVFSDFSGFDGECRKHLFQLSKQNQVKAYLVTDPLEQEVPSSGRYSVSDGNSTTWIDAGNKQTRKIYASTFEKQYEALAAELRLCRVSLKILSTVDNVASI